MVNGLTINVDKTRLLATLKRNRETHGIAYEQAKKGYIRVTTEQLKEYVELLANGELLVQRFINAPPEDHTGDYDDAIAMMEWAQDDDVELTQGQFRQYVQDDWGWKDSWVTSNTAYIEASGDR
jgi:hypothetical protein